MGKNKRYKLAKGVKKGLLAAASIGVGLAAGAEMLGSLSAVQEVTAIGVISAAVAAIRTGANWWKVNHDLADNTFLR